MLLSVSERGEHSQTRDRPINEAARFTREKRILPLLFFRMDIGKSHGGNPVYWLFRFATRPESSLFFCFFFSSPLTIVQAQYLSLGNNKQKPAHSFNPERTNSRPRNKTPPLERHLLIPSLSTMRGTPGDSSFSLRVSIMCFHTLPSAFRKESITFLVPSSPFACCKNPLSVPLILVPKRAVERVVENIAERQEADEVAALVDDDEPVHARLADRVEDGVEAVVQRASVNAGEVLRTKEKEPNVSKTMFFRKNWEKVS